MTTPKNMAVFLPDDASNITFIDTTRWHFDAQPFSNLNSKSIATSLAVEAFRFSGVHCFEEFAAANSVAEEICKKLNVDEKEIKSRGFKWQINIQAEHVAVAVGEKTAYISKGVDLSPELIAATRDTMLNDEKCSNQIKRTLLELRACKVGSAILYAITAPATAVAGWFSYPSHSPLHIKAHMEPLLAILYASSPITIPAITLLGFGALAATANGQFREDRVRKNFEKIKQTAQPLVAEAWAEMAATTIKPRYFCEYWGREIPALYNQKTADLTDNIEPWKIKQAVDYCTNPNASGFSGGDGFIIRATTSNPALRGTQVKIEAVRDYLKHAL